MKSSFLSINCLIVISLLLSGAKTCTTAEQSNTFTGNDSLVNLRNNIRLILPDGYSLHEGTGDDTKFVQILNGDGSIIAGYETGLRSGPKVTEDRTSLQKKYAYLQIIEPSQGIGQTSYQILLCYNDTEGSFRNAVGKVYLVYPTRYEEVCSASFGRKRLDELIQLFSSLSVAQ